VVAYILLFTNTHPSRCVSGLDAEETLVVVVSKTFSTAETMLNARTMRQWLWDRMSHGEPSAEVRGRLNGGLCMVDWFK